MDTPTDPMMEAVNEILAPQIAQAKLDDVVLPDLATVACAAQRAQSPELRGLALLHLEELTARALELHRTAVDKN